jgi:probable HAF family extracellular repeat protein
MKTSRLALLAIASSVGILPAAPALAGPRVTATPVTYLGGWNSGVKGLNDAGQVAGTRNTGFGETFHAFLWTPLTGVEDLGTFGGHNSMAYALNASGVVVGYANDAAGGVRAFLRAPGQPMVDLGDFNRDYTRGVVAEDVNDAGQVVGSAMHNSYGWYRTFVITPEDTDGDGQPDLWFRDSDGDGLNDLARDTAVAGARNRINAAGQVMSLLNNGGTVLWEEGVSTSLLGPDGSMFWGDVLNDAGWVAGTIQAGYYSRMPYLWRDGVVTVIPLPPGCLDLSGQLAMNNRGQVAGSCNDAAGRRAFLWDEVGGAIDLGTFGGTISDAYDVNEAGQVAGWAQLLGGELHAFVWSPATGMVDLGTLLGPYSEGFEINERGWVAGSSTNDLQYLHRTAVLWQVDFAPAPSAAPIVVTEPEQGATQVLPNDPDAGDTHDFSIAVPPAGGSATVDAGGVVTYVPATGFVGSDPFVVRVTDQGGAFGDVTVAVVVEPERVPPASAVTPAGGLYQQAVVVSLSASDNLDPSPIIRYTVDGSDPRVGGLDYSGPVRLTADTVLRFHAVDRRLNEEAVVHAAAYVVNHAPVPAAPAIVVRQGRTATSAVAPRDPDPVDATFAYRITVPPAHGAAQISVAGVVTYAADKRYLGPDGLVVEVRDPRGGVGTVSIPVTVTKK